MPGWCVGGSRILFEYHLEMLGLVSYGLKTGARAREGGGYKNEIRCFVMRGPQMYFGVNKKQIGYYGLKRGEMGINTTKIAWEKLETKS